MEQTNMSQLSNAIKVPMILLVIFVHENLNLQSDGYLGLTLATLANVAVPVFFLISGYYFFNGQELGKDAYIKKLKRRSRTLLLPYLLWNLLPMLNIVAGNLFSILFRGKSIEALQGYLLDLWQGGLYHIWWDLTAGTMPYDSPLWYIRDLMVMCLLSPVVYLFVRYLKHWGVGALLTLYVMGVNTGIVGLGMSAITFFTLGGHFSINASVMGTPNLFAVKWSKMLLPTTLISLVLYVVLYEWQWAHVFQMLYIVSGVFSFYCLMSLLSSKVVEWLCTLSSAVFFIYALHNTCVLAICGGWVNRLPLPHFLVIILIPFVTFVVCYFAYMVMKRVCPSVLAVLCGGRG